MKKEDEIGEKKIPKANAKDSHRWTPHVGKKAFKCKFKALEEGIFEMASVKNAAQILKSMLNISNYMQMNYNNKIGDAIKSLK